MQTLIRGVDLLCLDAGNTVIFLDHGRVAELCEKEGFSTTAPALIRAEGVAKLALEQGETLSVAWSHADVPEVRGWSQTVATMLVGAGLALERVPPMLERLWREHQARNLWSLVPQGLAPAIDKMRATGVRAAVVSNSEGFLARILSDLGILGVFDLVIDSGVVGVEKPDPRIFVLALESLGVPPSRALHLGDNYATDVLGARAAGLRVALVDPFGHLEGRHPDVPRVAGAPEVASLIAEAPEVASLIAEARR
jgi:putative hydrolase of the HAD superfamily